MSNHQGRSTRQDASREGDGVALAALPTAGSIALIAPLALALALGSTALAAPAGSGPSVAAEPVHRAAPVRLDAPAGHDQDPPAAIIHLPLAMAEIRLDQMPLPQPARPASATPPEPTQAPTEPPATPTEAPSPTPPPSPTPDLPWWGAYDEPVTDFASLDALRAAYRPATWYPTLLDLLALRYANGRHVVVSLKDSQQNAATWVGGNPASFDDLLGRVGVTVHEMDHQLGWQEGIQATSLQSYAYVLREDLTLLVPRVDTFPRAEIVPYLVGPLNNMYKPIYLEGQSGQQGFLTVLDEFNAYTHSLFVGYGLHDQTPPGRRQSDRDGLVTFMMYTEFYLRHARTTHPSDYALLRSKPEIRQAVKTLWARANFILDLSEDIPSLSLDPAAVEAEMRKPDMQAELRDFVLP